MTTGELIEKLRTYPAGTPVVVYGVEGGLDDADTYDTKAIFNVYPDGASWYGKHEEIFKEGGVRNKEGGVNCVVIARSFQR